MPSNYTRRISLYINGKEVKNDIASIKAEMNKLIGQQARMTIGSKEYVSATKNIKQLKGILAEHSNQLKSAESGWSGLKKAADGFNRYFAMFTAGAASIAGLVMGLRKAVDTFNEFEKSLASLSAITGLTGNDLTWIGDKAKELSVTTTESGIRITQSATDIVEGFKLMGSARPELLANKEALAQVTEKALILAAAAGIEMAPAVDAVSASMNQFNLDASQSDRIINSIAAGSLAGSAEVGDLTESMKNVGTVANDSNMSLEQTVAALEVLGEKQLKGAEAGTKLRGALLKMKDAGVGYASGQFNVRDALVEVNAQINSHTSAIEKDAIKQKVFGIENITAGNILLQNIDKYDKLSVAVTGTNVAFEQAKTATSTNSAKLEQAKNRVQLLTIEFGEKLSPAMTMSTNAFSYFMKVMLAGYDIFVKYKGAIITTMATVIAYSTSVKIMSLWENRRNAESVISIAISKLRKVAMLAEIAITQLWAAATMLASGNIKGAAQAMRVFNSVLKANPIGLIVGAVIALGSALYFLAQRTSSAQKAQEALISVEAEAMKSIVDQKLSMESLLKVARDETKSKIDRQLAVKKLNELSPEYLGNLTLEKINTQEAKKATDDYIVSLMKQARTMAAQEKMKELEKQKIDLQLSGKGSETSTWQDISNGILSMGNAGKFASLSMRSLADNYMGSMADINSQQAALENIISKDPTLPTTATEATNTALPPTNKAETDKAAEKAAKAAEEAYKQLQEIRKKEIESTLALMQDGYDKEMGQLKAKYNAEREEIVNELATNKNLTLAEKDSLYQTIANIDQKYLDDQGVLADANMLKVLKSDKDLLDLKLEGVRAGSAEEYQLKKDQLDKQLQIEIASVTGTEEHKQQIILALKAKFAKEQAKADEAYSIQFLDAKLKKDITDLNDAEQQKLDALKQKREAGQISQKEYNKQLIDLQSQYTKDSLTISIDKAQRELEILKAAGEDTTQAESTLAELRLKAQEAGTGKQTGATGGWDEWSTTDKLNMAVDTASQIADAEFQISRDKNQQVLDEKLSSLQKEREVELSNKYLTESQKNAINVEYDGKEKAVKQDAWKKQHKADVAQAWVNLALGVGKAAINMWPVPAIPMMAAAAISGGLQVSAVTSQKMPQFSVGGFTATDSSNFTPVGVVHANEYVVPEVGVNNPSLRPVLNMIEVARQSGNLPSLNAQTVMKSLGSGFKDGGYTSQQVGETANSSSSANSMASLIAANNAVMNALLQKLKEPTRPIEATVAIRGRNGLYEKLAEDKQSQNNASL